MDADLNRATWDSDRIAATYAAWGRAKGLFEAERAMLARVGDLSQAAVLDIGVGSGRTTAAIAPACREYVGVDFAPAMVARCKAAFPAYEFRVGDARDLSGFADAGFDLVLFSYNGIDYVSIEERAQVLREVRRVLRPGGWFLFTTHNLRRPPGPPGLLPQFATEGSFARRMVWNALGLVGHIGDRARYRARRHLERRGEGWASFVDDAHGYRLLTTYVTAEHQRALLAAAGFDRVEAYLLDGSAGDAGTRAQDKWLSFSARRPA